MFIRHVISPFPMMQQTMYASLPAEQVAWPGCLAQEQLLLLGQVQRAPLQWIPGRP